MGFARKEIVNRMNRQISARQPVVGVAASTGGSARNAEASGADLIAVYHTAKYAMAGDALLAGLLPFGDANQMVIDTGNEVLPAVKHSPVLAGVCGTDPFRGMEVHLRKLKDQGFSGVQNFPTVGLFDGAFRVNLEETDMGYKLEVEMIRKAHELDLFTCPYVFHKDDARSMAAAGADCLVVHLGLVTQGPIGAKTALTLDDCAHMIQDIGDMAKSVNPDILIMCHGGPIRKPEDVQYVMALAAGLNGWFEIGV